MRETEKSSSKGGNKDYYWLPANRTEQFLPLRERNVKMVYIVFRVLRDDLKYPHTIVLISKKVPFVRMKTHTHTHM